MTVEELIAHLSRIRNQDAPIMIRIQHHQLGQLDLLPAGITPLFDGSYAIELKDPWGTDEPWPEGPGAEELL